MSAITPDDVNHVALLARLSFTEEELERMVEELQAIVAWVDRLQEVDTEGVEPAGHVAGHDPRYRKDVSAGPTEPAQWLALAPDGMGDAYRVPRVVE